MHKSSVIGITFRTHPLRGHPYESANGHPKDNGNDQHYTTLAGTIPRIVYLVVFIIVVVSWGRDVGNIRVHWWDIVVGIVVLVVALVIVRVVVGVIVGVVLLIDVLVGGVIVVVVSVGFVSSGLVWISIWVDVWVERWATITIQGWILAHVINYYILLTPSSNNNNNKYNI